MDFEVVGNSNARLKMVAVVGVTFISIGLKHFSGGGSGPRRGNDGDNFDRMIGRGRTFGSDDDDEYLVGYIKKRGKS